jgi:hypothetical protein
LKPLHKRTRLPLVFLGVSQPLFLLSVMRVHLRGSNRRLGGWEALALGLQPQFLGCLQLRQAAPLLVPVLEVLKWVPALGLRRQPLVGSVLLANRFPLLGSRQLRLQRLGGLLDLSAARPRLS